MSEYLEPLGDRVVVLPEAAKAMTEGGLHIPDTAKEAPMVGSIVALPVDVTQGRLAEGARILYARYSGTPLALDGVEHLVIRLSDVLGIVRTR